MLVYLKTYCPEGDKQERNENQTQEMTGVMGVKSQRLSVRQIWLFCLLRWMCSSPLFVMMSCCQSEQVISGCSAVYHFVARRTAVVMKRPTSETQVTGWSAELQQEDSQCGWAEDQCDALLCSKRHTHMNTFLLAEVLLWNPEHCIYFALSRNGMCRKSVQQQGRKQNKKLRSSSTKNFKFHLTWTTFGHIQNNHYQRILLQGRKSSVSFHKACLKASEVIYALNLWRAASFKKNCVADGERQQGGRTLVGVLSSWEQSSDVESRSCSEELMKHRPQGSLGDSSCQDCREERGKVHTPKGEWARTHNRWVTRMLNQNIPGR